MSWSYCYSYTQGRYAFHHAKRILPKAHFGNLWTCISVSCIAGLAKPLFFLILCIFLYRVSKTPSPSIFRRNAFVKRTSASMCPSRYVPRVCPSPPLPSRYYVQCNSDFLFFFFFFFLKKKAKAGTVAGWVCVWVGMRFRNPFGRKKEGRHPLDTRYRKIRAPIKNNALAKSTIQDTLI